MQLLQDRLRLERDAAIPGIADCPTGVAAWAQDNTSKVRLTQLQSLLLRAEADAHKAAVFEALCAATDGRSLHLAAAARAAAACLRSCMGACASAWLTALS